MIWHLVLEGVAEGPLGVGLDVVSTAAKLARAQRGGAAVRAERLRQRVVSLDGAPVRSGTLRPIAVDGALSLRSLRPGDAVLLPGLSAATPAAMERLLVREDTARAMVLLRRAAARGATVAASCSATFVLGAAGLLDGASATTTWWLAREFARRFPEVELRADRMVIERAGVLTAGSAFAHADLALALVARLTSPSLAHLAARYLVLDERPSQARYMVLEHLKSADPIIQALERFIGDNLHRQLGLDEMAKAAGASPRTLARRLADGLGTTPQRFAQRMRIAHAQHLLETTREPVEEIAARVGYADGAAFRRVFRRLMGESPRGRA